MYLRAWRYDLVDFIARAADFSLLPSYREAEAIMAAPPDAAWSVELPVTKDLRSHQTFEMPSLGGAGAWLIAASLRADFAEPGNQRVAVNFLLSDLVLLTREADGGHEVTARSGASGRALEDVEVTLFRFDYQKGHRAVELRRTGADGRVRFGSRSWSRSQYFVLGRQGENLALDAEGLWRPAESRRDIASSALLYTDRAVYRPLQELHWKAVAYRGGGEELEYATLPGTELEVSLIDANGDEVASSLVTTNGFGSASGSFEIPAGRLLGQWRLRSSLGGEAWLRVEEYKRPTFSVEIDDPEAALRLNREAELDGRVLYYFGLPVSAGEVRWRVSREPVYPRWWSWWDRSPSAQTQVVAGGEAALDAEGRFRLRFTPEADEREAARGVSYRYRLAVDVTDEGGETRSAERLFRLGFVAVEARLLSERGFVRAGEPATVRALRSDLDGTPRSGAASWRLLRLTQPAETLTPAEQPLPPAADDSFATPGDRVRPRWQPDYEPDEVLALWPEGEEVAAGALEHGADGAAELALPGLEAGAYRLAYSTTDEFGAEFTTREHLVVVGESRTPLALPALLRFERSSAAVGETARLLVHTGFKAQEMVLELYRDGRRIERRDLGAGRSGVVELPVTAADRGGIGVALTLVRDHQLVRETARLAVPWDDRRLDIELASFRDTMRPGARESFAVTVRRHDGGPVDSAAAELLALMFDRSLDIFAPYEPPGVAALYPDRSAVGRLGASLGRATQAWGSSSLPELPVYPALHGDSLKGLDGHGIGGPGARGLYRHMKAGMALQARAEMAAMPAPMAADAAVEGKAANEVLADEGAAGAPADAGAAPEGGSELRSDFAETAFWRPHLVLGPDGSATVEFEVPDSVTEWNLWVHAVTRDLRGGSATRRARSVKELMVRPYLPRFLREGDRALLEVAVNNAGEQALAGSLNLEIVDPETGVDLRPQFGLDAARTTGVAFSVEPGAGTTLSFPLAAPPRVGQVAFKVTARAGGFSDGELRALPLLPGRMHLMQSRFVALRDRDRREMRFADLAAQDDPSLINDRLVVTVDGQLFYSVLDALPYLVEYPHECTEQTLNRFLSTGIVASLFDRYPSVERMAEQLSARETRTESWQAVDPNRAMALVETPWLALSRGGSEQPDELIKVLDPAVTRAQRSAALAALEKSQTSLGGFPWFPGGPPSPWMTLYILSGFAKGLEFGVAAPEGMVQEAWAYLHRHWVDEWADWMVDRDCCWETVTFLNYVLASYPDESWTGGVFTADDRRRMLDFSFRHWREHSPLTKGYLALTLERAGRHEDAVLVFDAVMDSAKTDPDLGTYWAPEDRAWLWYNDTIETHAFALRTLTELAPEDPRRHGLVQWLFLNKKLNHWKSTRATAEVLYSLAHYLRREQALEGREVVEVAVGPRRRTFVFSPEEYSGARNRLVVEGPEIEPASMATVVVEKETPGFAFASATWHFSTERLPEEARGDLFAVERSYLRRFNDGSGWALEPLADGMRLEPGDQVEVQLSIRAKHAAEYVHLRDPRGAGFEPETLHSQYTWDLGIAWYEEVRDSGTNFFFEWLPAGEYTLRYRLRATMAGTFRVAPAVLQSMYAPEFTAYSAGNTLEVDPG